MVLFKISFKGVLRVLKVSFMGVLIVFIEVITTTRAYGGLDYCHLSLSFLAFFYVDAAVFPEFQSQFLFYVMRAVFKNMQLSPSQDICNFVIMFYKLFC